MFEIPNRTSKLNITVKKHIILAILTPPSFCSIFKLQPSCLKKLAITPSSLYLTVSDRLVKTLPTTKSTFTMHTKCVFGHFGVVFKQECSSKAAYHQGWNVWSVSIHPPPKISPIDRITLQWAWKGQVPIIYTSKRVGDRVNIMPSNHTLIYPFHSETFILML